MNQLGNLLDRWLKNSGYYKTVKQQQAIVYWRQIVGDYLADACQPVKIEAGVLWVKTKNSTWLHHLTMLKSEILRKISEYTGNNNIKDIYFILGNFGMDSDDKENNFSNLKNNKLKEKLLINQQRVIETENINSEKINEWLKDVPEDEPEIKEKLAILIYKRYHIDG